MTKFSGSEPTSFEPGLLALPVIRALPELRELLILAEHVTKAGWERERPSTLEQGSWLWVKMNYRQASYAFAGNTSLFLIPRSSLPPLPRRLKQSLDFYFTGDRCV